jgi:DNA-binding response OmpR family regulator
VKCIHYVSKRIYHVEVDFGLEQQTKLSLNLLALGATYLMIETKSTPRILLVDDDTELCDLVSQYLRGRGLVVDIEGDGEMGLNRAQTGDYDLLVLDVMLPGKNGFEILKQLRTGGDTSLPVVMLTAHGDEIDRIVGLELGADDYLPKPFNPRELLARLNAVLRRGAEKNAVPAEPPRQEEKVVDPAPPQEEWLQVGEITMNLSSHAVRRSGVSVELTATEFDILRVLMKNAGRVVSREELAREALGRRLLPLERSLDLHMSKLRRKLGAKSEAGEPIKTLRGVGFLMERDEVNP